MHGCASACHLEEYGIHHGLSVDKPVGSDLESAQSEVIRAI